MVELKLGDGSTGIHPGRLGSEITVCFTTLSTGFVGEETTNKDLVKLEPGEEKLRIIFENEQALDVLIQELSRVKKLFAGVSLESC